ncbi:MAG: hypothetical protein DRQ88_07220 [Epsilonproteobacteria bacterium]|nr:MAG: hypothetical protein DRQ89_03195 [Campylobacterota bacterium]RLA66272.1 MAG: hypothetical protein DRQ88_07220 [Campylobacterota bacterium]
MSYLYIDSSKYLVLGLLDSDFKWIDFNEVKDVKTSAHIHKDIYEMLEKHNLELDKLSGIFVVSGPGSYTGVRVSEGLAQVLEWQKIPIYSFNHFQIPEFLDESSWAFVSKAFKGEFFTYEKNGKTSLNKLEDFDNIIDGLADKIYTHFPEDLPTSLNHFTSIVVKDNPEVIFSKVLEKNLRSRPFYYRPLEKEFKVPSDASNLSK